MPSTTSVEVTGPDRSQAPQCRARHGSIAVRTLAAGPGRIRVALVSAEALLLAGDHVRLVVSVRGPVLLEVVETAGTVAYDMRGGRARWDVEVTARDGARVHWAGEPFVVSAGARVERRTHVEVDASSAVALREQIVLGRTDQTGGDLVVETRARRDGAVLAVERLDLSRRPRRSWATLHDARCLETVSTFGVRMGEGVEVLQGEETTSQVRSLGRDLHRVTRPEAWREAVRAAAPVGGEDAGAWPGDGTAHAGAAGPGPAPSTVVPCSGASRTSTTSSPGP